MNKLQLIQSKAIRFRQFTRKGYAAFCSLHREVTMGRISRSLSDLELLKAGQAAVVLGLSLMCAGNIDAETLDENGNGLTAEQIQQQLSVPEVLVVATQAELNSQSYRLVTQVSAEQIQGLPITTVADILQYLPGIDIRTRGANGAQADISMRGGTFDQVLVMVNGVNLSDSHTGHYSLNLPISPSLIERIEILQGTSANLFGLNAFSGAINIITKQPKQEVSDAFSGTFYGKMSAGMNGYINPEFSTRMRKKEWYLNASAEYSRSDGYDAPHANELEKKACDNSDYKIANIYLQTGWRGLDIQMGAQYKDAGAGCYYGFGSQEQFDATRTAFASAAYTHQWGRWSLDVQASYRANYDRYEWWRGKRQGGNFHFTQNIAAGAKAHYASKIGRTSVGIEVRNDNIHSTNLGDTINPNGQVPNKKDFPLSDVKVLQLVKGANRLSVNYFAEQSFCYKDLSASVGVSGNYNTQFGNNFAGGANIGYRYAKNGNVYINANRSLRLPTFTDLYYNAGKQLGDRNLKPEEAWMLSVGTKYATGFGEIANGKPAYGQLSVALDAYYRWGKNIIDWVRVDYDDVRPYHATNHNNVNSTGLEAAIEYQLNQWLPSVRLSYAYTYLDLDVTKSGSRYLDYLSHHFTAHIEHAIYVFGGKKGTLGASWTLSYKQREGHYDDVNGETQAYKPICLLDGQVYWKNDMIKVSADCTNMTNRHYYDYGGILQPGAWAKATVSFQL